MGPHRRDKDAAIAERCPNSAAPIGLVKPRKAGYIMRYDRYDDIEERVEREAVLSIPRPWRPAYFAVFTLQLIWWLSITIYLEAGVPEYRNWQANMVGIMRAMSPLTQAAIAFTVVAMELARYLMLLAPHFEVKIKARARAEGLAEGKAEGLAEGKAAGKAIGIAEGKAAGKAIGIAEGKAVGLEEGKAAGKAIGLEEGKAVGKAAGKAEANREWLEWFADKAAAEAAGEPFDKPSPAEREERKQNGDY